MPFYIFIFLISIYLLTSSDTTMYGDAVAKYEVTKSLVERFDISIPDGFGIKGIDGKDYSWYGIGYSVISIPFYIIGKYTGSPEGAVSMVNLLFGAMTAVLVFLFCSRFGYSDRSSFLITIFYGLGIFS